MGSSREAAPLRGCPGLLCLAATPTVDKANAAVRYAAAAGIAGGAIVLPVLVAFAGDKPDVAILDRVAVVLELNRQRLRAFLLAAARFGSDFAMPVDGNAIVEDGDV